ncbi:MAG: bifunctional phosphoribosylaminoimidazolecarboxamide formyltransferase/IMP cyclohydrolase [bacterium]|nr:bifunctional phosphoribosylaminoimidazolecarboxamide formyltransferase/IMP cyclohydrolase [bacterium]
MPSDKHQKVAGRYALISVFDKTGICEFAKALQDLGYKIISTGGTAKALSEQGIKVIPIQEITGNPESFNGRMKTISFQIESGILFDRTNLSHTKQAEELNIKPIDIVVCNLYPFEQTISKEGVKLDDAIESIDVGGPTMIRAAGKNLKNVLVIVDPGDYSKLNELLNKNEIDENKRKELAGKAFAHLSFYDSQIAKYLNPDNLFPNELTIPGRKVVNLRYGENPHQKAAFYLNPNTNSPLKNLEKKWGRDLSHINLTDINAGLESVKLFSEPTAVIIKHNCPCGIALGKTAEEALKKAIEADPESAFGGIIVLNKEMNLETAKVIGAFKDERKSNIDIVAVPEISNEALEYLQKVRKSMGIYTFGEVKSQKSKVKSEQNIRFIDGGFIAQTADDNIEESFKDWKVVTKVKPTKKQLEQMQLAWKFISRIKSNAMIVVDKDLPMTRGIGTGQTSRVRSTRIALEKAGKYAKGGILASDGFFPFDDSVKMAVDVGISAIVQPGGSVNDKLSIAATDKAGIPMVITRRRAFWH